MKPSVNNSPEKLSKRAEKKRVNIRANTRVNFQIGLIVSMMLAILAMEISYAVDPNPAYGTGIDLVQDPAVFKYVLDTPVEKVIAAVKKPVVKPPVRKKIVLSTLAPEIDNTLVDAPDIAPLDPGPLTPDTPIVTAPTTPTKPPVNTGPTNVVNVEHVPVFPGCEAKGTNSAKIACMSSKIAAFVNRKFRTDDFDDLSGDPIQKIFVQFTIDRNGNVTTIKARSKHDELEKEAKRVISKLPVMQPGRQGDTNVDVIYIVPISLQIKY